MSLDYSIIGERIKKARISKGLTQEKLAEKMEVSVAFLSRVERGSTHLNLNRLGQLCTLLDISEGEILNGTSYGNSNYIQKDLGLLLQNCSPEKQRLIYDIAKVIVESN